MTYEEWLSAVQQLHQLRSQIKELTLQEKALAGEVLEFIHDLDDTAQLVAAGDHTVSLSRGTATYINVDILKGNLPAEVFDRITKKSVDRSAFQIAVDEGHIPAWLHTQAVTQGPRTPVMTIKTTKKEATHE